MTSKGNQSSTAKRVTQGQQQVFSSQHHHETPTKTVQYGEHATKSETTDPSSFEGCRFNSVP